MRVALVLLTLPLVAQDIVGMDLVPGHAILKPQAIPEAQLLIKRMLDKSEAIRSARESYTYREELTEQKLDGAGRSTESTTRRFEVIRLHRGQVRRLLEVDGVPLSTEEARKEEERIQAQLKSLGESSSAPSDSKSREIQLTVQDILAVSDIGPVTRVAHQGHEVFQIGFRPKPGVSPKGMGQRLAAKLEGRLLVDERSDQVVRAEGRLTESFWVGGGLLGAVLPPSTFVLEQQRVADNLWMPVRGSFSLHARVTFVPLRRSITFRCWDFQRFSVEPPTIEKAAPH